jgi:ligand-binding sensor domain-containing protein
MRRGRLHIIAAHCCSVDTWHARPHVADHVGPPLQLEPTHVFEPAPEILKGAQLKRPARCRFLLLVVILCCAFPYAVQGKQVPVWASFTRENSGLPNDEILSLALGQDGTLWVGTDSGLARLDRQGRWQILTRANTGGGLPNDFVQALEFAQDGTLWVGTFGGLARLNNGHWQSYTQASTSGGLPSDDILALALGQDGTAWVGTTGGLAFLDRQGRWLNYTRASTGGRLLNVNIQAIALGQDGMLWVGTDGGLARLDHGRWQSYTRANTSGGNDILALALAQDGTIWIGTKRWPSVAR